jgi:hypothetical protein
MARQDLFKDTEKELWKKFDELFKDVNNMYGNSFTTTQSRETPLPVKAGANDMKELLDKYNALKLYVTGVETENKKLKTDLESSNYHYGIAITELQKRGEVATVLDKVILLLERVRETL